MASEAHKRKPEYVLAEAAAYPEAPLVATIDFLQSASLRLWDQSYHSRKETHELGLTSIRILVLLDSIEGGPPLSRVSDRLFQEAQSTTESADRLERRGFVTRERDPSDRRLVLLQITDAGRAIANDLRTILGQYNEELKSLILEVADALANSTRDLQILRADLQPAR